MKKKAREKSLRDLFHCNQEPFFATTHDTIYSIVLSEIESSFKKPKNKTLSHAMHAMTSNESKCSLWF